MWIAIFTIISVFIFFKLFRRYILYKKLQRAIQEIQSQYNDYRIIVLHSPECQDVIEREKEKNENTLNLFYNNGIQEFYHITPVENLNSIFIGFRALLSYEELQKHNVKVKYISNEDSHINDKIHGTQNYVKLSFRKITPMIYDRIRKGERLALLGIDPNIIKDYDQIFFCHTNSTVKNAKYYRINNTDENSKLRFDVINAKHGFLKNTPEYAAMQAEIMVKVYIPLRYIRFIKELDINDLK